MRRFAMIAGVYLMVLVLAVVVVRASDAPDADVASDPPPEGNDFQLASALERFDDCDQLLSYFRDEALERVGPYGLGGYDPRVMMDTAMESAGADATGGSVAGAPVSAPAPAMDSAARASNSSGSQAYSQTNVQEAGIDEPDIVKTDGERVLAIAAGQLHILGIDDAELTQLSSIAVPGDWGQEILLDGDRVLVVGRGYDDAIAIGGPEPAMDRMIGPGMIPGGGAISQLTMIDIANPSAPEVTASLQLDGEYVSARLIDGVARVVVRSQPIALPFVMPEAGGLRAEEEATDANREVVRESTIEDWLPYSIAKNASGVETERSLLECDQVHHPKEFGGFGMVSVLSVDLAGDLSADGAAAVIGDAQTVYASDANLYVALNRWGGDMPMPVEGGGVGSAPAPVDNEPTTTIHRFDISDPTTATYAASGEFDGTLLSQWSLSEHEGFLRVATTTGGFDDRTQSSVLVLRATGDELDEVGRVDGLGKGERVYAVRYAGDIGYVVTFRQTDPLYTLDLSDPRGPRVRGELKINGYSAYLHPLADGRVLGIGQDATDEGQVKGSQASLFDVADLTAPARVDQLFLGKGNSSVEYDSRAFLYWAATNMAVVPLQTWDAQPFSGVVVLRLDGDRLSLQGRISHSSASPVGGDSKGGMPAPDYVGGPMVSRALVVGDSLLTVSDVGVAANRLDDLGSQDWVPFSK